MQNKMKVELDIPDSSLDTATKKLLAKLRREKSTLSRKIKDQESEIWRLKQEISRMERRNDDAMYFFRRLFEVADAAYKFKESHLDRGDVR